VLLVVYTDLDKSYFSFQSETPGYGHSAFHVYNNFVSYNYTNVNIEFKAHSKVFTGCE